MRATRFLLAALAALLVAACAGEPVGVIQADRRPSFDGTGSTGPGDSVESDTTGVSRGVGFVGSGN